MTAVFPRSPIRPSAVQPIPGDALTARHAIRMPSVKGPK